MVNFKRVLSLIVACLLVGTIFAACGSAGTPSANTSDAKTQAAQDTKQAAQDTQQASAEKKQLMIGVAMDDMTDPYWKADIAAMQAEADKSGVKLLIQAAQGDDNKQIQQIEAFIAQKVDAVICAPHNDKAVLEVVKKCNEAKIPFISNDRIVKGTADAKVDYSVGTDNYQLTKIGAQWFVDYAKKNNVKLKVLELLGDLGDPNTADRAKGFEELAGANKDVIEVVAKVPTEWKPEKALAGTVNALQANKDINAIFFHSDFLLPAVQSALKQVNRYTKNGEKGHMLLGALGGATGTLDLIKDGYFDCLMSCPIIKEGQLSVQNAIALAKGQKIDKDVYQDPGFTVSKDNFDEMAYKSFGYLGKQK